ncbi:MAG: thioredoxin family protein [Flavobacteriaceae bacterium]
MGALFLLFSFFAHSQDWKTTYQEALHTAEKGNKPLILVFSGSDWCAPCIKLDRQIWQSTDFKDHAQKHYVLYKADFPRKKGNRVSQEVARTNAQLAERFNPRGYFPLVLVMGQDEKVLGRFDYKNVSPTEYIELLNSVLK